MCCLNIRSNSAFWIASIASDFERVRKRHKRLKKEESEKDTKATRPQDCIAKKGAFGSGLLSEGSEAMDGGESYFRPPCV